MTTELFTNVILQVPALAVVVYLVVHFLAYLRASREDERQYMAQLTKDQSQIINRNTDALIENHVTVQETRDVLSQCRVVLEQQHITKDGIDR
jgi:uncharacterized tellurite resistance protein B-like protein